MSCMTPSTDRERALDDMISLIGRVLVIIGSHKFFSADIDAAFNQIERECIDLSGNIQSEATRRAIQQSLAPYREAIVAAARQLELNRDPHARP